MELIKQSNETRNHFIWRVYQYQRDTGLINDEQAGEICRKQLNENYDESAYRKKYQSFIDMFNDLKFEYVNEQSILERLDLLDKREDELYKKLVKTSDWVREKRKVLRDEARIENLKESFKESLDRAEEIVFEKYETKHVGELSAVLMLSDFHVGMDIENFWNTYNLKVFQERLKTLAYKVLKYSEKNNIGKLYVANLGDMISGSIHATTRLAEEMDALDQVMAVAKALKNFLKELEDFGLEIVYISVVGNHDRINKNYKEHIEKESFNKIVDWYILDKIEDGYLKIEFINNEIDDGIGFVMIDDEPYFFVHGHLDSIGTVVYDLAMGTGIIPKGVFMGHYHNKTSATIKGSKVFVNGSLIGVDEFAKDKRYFNKPSQSLVVFDEDDVVDIELRL